MLDFCGESHIIKVIKVEANESIGSPKRKDPPSRSCRSERGSSLFSAYGQACKLSAQCLTFWEKAHIIKTIKVVIKLVI